MSGAAGGGIEDEDIEVIELPFSEAVAMIADGRIKDGKTIMLLQYLQIHRVMKKPVTMTGFYRFAPGRLLQQRLRLGHHVVHGEAELGEQLRRRRLTEGGHAHDGAV